MYTPLGSTVEASPALPSVSVDFLAGKGTCLPHMGTQDGMPQLWLDLLTLQGRCAPVWTFSSLQIPSRGAGPDLMLLFSILVGYMEIFLIVLVV